MITISIATNFAEMIPGKDGDDNAVKEVTRILRVLADTYEINNAFDMNMTLRTKNARRAGWVNFTEKDDPKEHPEFTKGKPV